MSFSAVTVCNNNNMRKTKIQSTKYDKITEIDYGIKIDPDHTDGQVSGASVIAAAGDGSGGDAVAAATANAAAPAATDDDDNGWDGHGVSTRRSQCVY